MISTRAAASWVSSVTRLDAHAAQRRVVDALHDFVSRGVTPTEASLQALLHIDCELAYLLPVLNADYLKHHQDIQGLEPRFWQAVEDLCRSLLQAYETFFEAAVAPPAAAELVDATRHQQKLLAYLPEICARLLYYKLAQGKLRLYRVERWIPAHWRLANRVYAAVRAREQGDVISAMFAPNPNEPALSVEERYLMLALLQRLDSGNLAPPDIQRAVNWLASWVKGLWLSVSRPTRPCFAIDLCSTEGLRPVGSPDTESLPPSASTLFLDIGPLWSELTAATQSAHFWRQCASTTDERRVAAANLVLLRKLSHAWAPPPGQLVRRSRRIPAAAAARVARGFSDVCRALHYAPSDPMPLRAVFKYDDMLDLHVFGFVREHQIDPTGQRTPASAHAVPPPLLAAPEDAETLNRSETGVGLRLQAPVERRCALGMLMASRDELHKRWSLGVVRRIQRADARTAEVGLQLLSQRPVVVKLIGQTAFSAMGVAAGQQGPGSGHAIFLPASRVTAPQPASTLLVAKSEFQPHRLITLQMGHSYYTVRLQPPIETGIDWVWAGFDLVERRLEAR